jgi:hypothetical protein
MAAACSTSAMRQTAAAPGADQHVDAKRALHQHGPRVARRAGRRRVSWPVFLADFRRQAARPIYRSPPRTLAGVPPIRRDLVKRHLYLVPNSIVVSRGCPHVCDFCYKEAFFEGGRSFYGAAASSPDRPPSPRRLRRRLEEVRAALGPRHPREAGRRDAAVARESVERIRPAPGAGSSDALRYPTCAAAGSTGGVGRLARAWLATAMIGAGGRDRVTVTEWRETGSDAVERDRSDTGPHYC